MFSILLPEEIDAVLKRWEDQPLSEVNKEMLDAQKKHTLQQFIEWGNGDCPHPKHIDVIVRDPNIGGQQYYIEGKRKDCSQCWAELEEVEKKKT